MYLVRAYEIATFFGWLNWPNISCFHMVQHKHTDFKRYALNTFQNAPFSNVEMFV